MTPKCTPYLIYIVPLGRQCIIFSFSLWIKESKRRHWDSTDANEVDYVLMVAILDSFIQLFVPFTALCPNENPDSFDIATHLRSCNVKWIRVQVGTQSGNWSKQLNKWIKNDYHQNIINLIFIRGVSMYRFASLRTLYISLQKVFNSLLRYEGR